jgi:hypothetical protein
MWIKRIALSLAIALGLMVGGAGVSQAAMVGPQETGVSTSAPHSAPLIDRVHWRGCGHHCGHYVRCGHWHSGCGYWGYPYYRYYNPDYYGYYGAYVAPDYYVGGCYRVCRHAHGPSYCRWRAASYCD